MLLQSLSFTFMLLLFENSPILAATTIRFFHDSKCTNFSGIWDPIEPAWRTGCHKLEAPFPESFSSSRVDSGCSVVFYGDLECSSNATRVPADESCISRAQFLSFARPCGSESPPLDSTSAIYLTRSINSPEAVATSATFSSQASSFSQAVSSRIPSEGGGTGGGLSTAGTIAIGVVLPAVSIIVAIIFGLRTWNSGFRLRRARDFMDMHLNNRRDHSIMPISQSSAALVNDGGNGEAAASQELIRANKNEALL